MFRDFCEFIMYVFFGILTALVIVGGSICGTRFVIGRPACNTTGEMMQIKTEFRLFGGCYYQQPDGTYLAEDVAIKVMATNHNVAVTNK